MGSTSLPAGAVATRPRNLSKDSSEREQSSVDCVTAEPKLRHLAGSDDLDSFC